MSIQRRGLGVATMLALLAAGSMAPQQTVVIRNNRPAREPKPEPPKADHGPTQWQLDAAAYRTEKPTGRAAQRRLRQLARTSP